MANPNPILLQFSTLDGFYSKIIQFGTWDWCSHVSLVLDDGSILDALPGKGVSVHPYIDYARVERYAIKGLDADTSAKIIAFEKSQIGKPYDWSGIFDFGIRRNRNWKDDKAWFCSELQAAAFELSGFELVNTVNANRVAPKDLRWSPLLVYKSLTTIKK